MAVKAAEVPPISVSRVVPWVVGLAGLYLHNLIDCSFDWLPLFARMQLEIASGTKSFTNIKTIDGESENGPAKNDGFLYFLLVKL